MSTRRADHSWPFLQACEKAMATFELNALKRIEDHGAREWTADAWRLERRFPEKHGRRDRLTYQHSPLEVVVHSVPRETGVDRVGPAFSDMRPRHYELRRSIWSVQNCE